MKKLSIQVTAKSLKNTYTIEIDEKFCEVFEKDWETLTRGERSIDERDLLYAYMQKCWENYLQNKELDNIINERRKANQNKIKA